MALTTKQKIKIAQLLSGCVRTLRRGLRYSDDIAEVTRKGIRWRLDLREGIDLYIYLLGVFEWVTVRAYSRLIKPGDVVLDIGANIGAHMLQFARLVGPSGHVYAFEPTQYAYDKLQTNIRLNPYYAPEITALQAMLVASNSSALAPEIYSSWPLRDDKDANEQHGGVMKSTRGASAMTLDDALSRLGVKKVDFVKLDVDGHECEVLEGWTTIDKYKPKILLELAHVGDDAHVSNLLNLLSKRGYQFFKVGGATLTALQIDNALIQSIRAGTSYNVLALPAAKDQVTSLAA